MMSPVCIALRTICPLARVSSMGPNSHTTNAMKLADCNYDNSETGCCARLDVEQWDHKTLHWDEKPFLHDHARAVLHVPLNMSSVMTRDHAAIEAAQAYAADPICLCDSGSPWKTDTYIALDREVPGVDVVTMSGTFMTRVFEGPYRNTADWAKELAEYVRGHGREIDRTYFYYPSCPKCAEQFGHNYAVGFAKLRDEASEPGPKAR